MCVHRVEDQTVDISDGSVPPLVVLVLKAGLLDHLLVLWGSHLIFLVQSILTSAIYCNCDSMPEIHLKEMCEIFIEQGK